MYCPIRSALSCIFVDILHGDLKLSFAYKTIVVQIELLHYLSVELLLATSKSVHEFFLCEHSVSVLVNHFKRLFK